MTPRRVGVTLSLLFATLLAVVPTTEAAPITIYDESVSGDLTAATLITLGAGISAVVGQAGHFKTNNLFDSDGFTFVIPTGYQLDLFEATFSAISYLGPQVAGTLSLSSYQVQPVLWTATAAGALLSAISFADNCASSGSCALITGGTVLAPSFTATFASKLPLGAGTYGLSVGSGSAFASLTNTFTFHVSQLPPPTPVPTPAATPEPGSIVLLGSGLLALASLARRQRVRA